MFIWTLPKCSDSCLRGKWSDNEGFKHLTVFTDLIFTNGLEGMLTGPTAFHRSQYESYQVHERITLDNSYPVAATNNRTLSFVTYLSLLI